jgi:NitT/TauT family transport system substrate-binding protein
LVLAPLSWLARLARSRTSLAPSPQRSPFFGYEAAAQGLGFAGTASGQSQLLAPGRRDNEPPVRLPAEGASLSAFFRALVLFGLLAFTFTPATARAEGLKAGILKFGTVEWLLDVIKQHKLDAKEGYELSTLALASNNALQVALLGREADVIVTDWFWVLRQRAAGDDFQFAPYSTAVGAVMVPASSPIKSIEDLRGKKIGVAGGPLDKGWLLLRARSLDTNAGDLSEAARPVYGAPPLLNQQAIYGDVDALLTYWHFAAQLEAAGFRRLTTVTDLMKQVGLKTELPLIGFAFSGKLAKAKPDVVAGFVRSVRAAQDILLKSDAEWERIRPLMRPASDAEFITLRDRYREGITFAWGPDQQAEAAKLFGILARLGGDDLTGKNVAFDPQIFWQAPSN